MPRGRRYWLLVMGSASLVFAAINLAWVLLAWTVLPGVGDHWILNAIVAPFAGAAGIFALSVRRDLDAP